MITDDLKRRYRNDATFHALVRRILQASEADHVAYSFRDIRAAVDVAEYIAFMGGGRRHDVTCAHGTAMDVHCCNCHGGFLFDALSCVCRFEGLNKP